MNEPLGEFGGEVLRKLILFQDELPVGHVLSPETLGDVSLRHRKALKGAGLVKYYSEPEGVAAGLVTTEPSVKPTVAKSPPNQPKKTGSKNTSKSTVKKGGKRK